MMVFHSSRLLAAVDRPQADISPNVRKHPSHKPLSALTRQTEMQGVGMSSPAIDNRLHAEIIKAISQPDTRDRISKLGAVPFTETPGEFAAAIAADRKRLGDVITKTGIVLAD